VPADARSGVPAGPAADRDRDHRTVQRNGLVTERNWRAAARIRCAIASPVDRGLTIDLNPPQLRPRPRPYPAVAAGYPMPAPSHEYKHIGTVAGCATTVSASSKASTCGPSTAKR
jgi:hypothetical protein